MYFPLSFFYSFLNWLCTELNNNCHFRTSFCEDTDGFSVRRELQDNQTTASCPRFYGWRPESVCPPRPGPSYGLLTQCISVGNKRKRNQ